MPNYEATIDETVRGNAKNIIRTVSAIPDGAALSDAYFALLDPDGVTQLFQKHITTSLVAGEGQIEDDGADDGVAIIRFELTPANTLLCTGGTPQEPVMHPYGIEVQTDGGQPYEFEQGGLPVLEERVVVV